jgi:hypothetical protein
VITVEARGDLLRSGDDDRQVVGDGSEVLQVLVDVITCVSLAVRKSGRGQRQHEGEGEAREVLETHGAGPFKRSTGAELTHISRWCAKRGFCSRLQQGREHLSSSCNVSALRGSVQVKGERSNAYDNAYDNLEPESGIAGWFKESE